MPFCIAGGVALSAVGLPRATQALNFCVAITEADIPRLQALLEQAYPLVNAHPAPIHLGIIPFWLVIITDEQGKTLSVDFLLATKDPYNHAVENPLNVQLDGLLFPVANLADLIAMKRLAGRPRDIEDIQRLTQLNQEYS